MKDTVHALLLAVAATTGIAILVVGLATLPEGIAAGLALCACLAVLTYWFRVDIKSRRGSGESDAAPDDQA